MAQQRRARRRAELAGNCAAVDRNAFQQKCRCGRGDRQDAVGAADLPAADMYIGAENFLRREKMHEKAHADHVYQSVQRADLVEMNLIDGSSVDLRFCAGNQPVDRQRISLHRLRQVQMRQQVFDVMQPRVMVRVFMTMTVFLLVQCVQLFFAMHQNLHVCARDAAFDGGLGGNLNARKTERAHGIEKRGLVVQQLIQSCHQHIACRSHRAVQI